MTSWLDILLPLGCRLRQRKAEEQEVLPAAELEEEEEEEEESEYETDSDEEQIGRQMLKPVFVTKKERETIAEREALEREELEAMKREKASFLLHVRPSVLCCITFTATLQSMIYSHEGIPDINTCCLLFKIAIHV